MKSVTLAAFLGVAAADGMLHDVGWVSRRRAQLPFAFATSSPSPVPFSPRPPSPSATIPAPRKTATTGGTPRGPPHHLFLAPHGSVVPLTLTVRELTLPVRPPPPPTPPTH